MRNERGLTLVELLATLTIGIVLIGMATGGFLLLTQQLKATTQRHQDNFQESLLMTRLSRELTDSYGVVFKNGTRSELRFLAGNNEYKTLYYDNNTLYIADFIPSTISSTKSINDLKIDAITNLSDSTKYKNAFELANNISGKPTYKKCSTISQCTAFQSDNENLLPNENRLLVIEIPYTITTRKMYTNSTKSVTKSITIKLLDDTP